MYFNNAIKKVKNKKNKWITIVVIFSILMVVFSGISFGKTLHNSIIKNNAQICKTNFGGRKKFRNHYKRK